MKVIGLLLLILLAACTTQVVEDDDADGRTVVNERTVVTERGEGNIIAAVTGDASRSMKVTVDNIELYSDSWRLIAGDEETYELRDLPGRLVLAGQQKLRSDTYTQLRLDISSAVIDGQNAQVPAEKFVVPLNLAVPPGENTVIVVDIHGDESVQLVNGRYVFAPVITVHTCVDATVTVDGRVVHTSCQVTPFYETYTQQISGQVVVNTVYREQPVIIVERTTVQNNTVVYNNTVIRETNTGNASGNRTNTTNATA